LTFVNRSQVYFSARHCDEDYRSGRGIKISRSCKLIEIGLAVGESLELVGLDTGANQFPAGDSLFGVLLAALSTRRRRTDDLSSLTVRGDRQKERASNQNERKPSRCVYCIHHGKAGGSIVYHRRLSRIGSQ